MKLLNQKLIWGLFFISIPFALAGNLSGLGFGSTENKLALSCAFILPFLAVYAHSLYSLGAGRSLFFLGLSFFTGLAFEVVGVNFGTAFGSFYSYAMPGPAIAGVPLVIPLFWFVFIYTVYGSVNAFIRIKGGSLPVRTAGGLGFLSVLVLLDAFLVTAIDLVMEPVMVGWEKWTWTGTGPYFGIPTENFFGWFLVALIVSGIFRAFEYFKPGNEPDRTDRATYIPLLGLLSIYASFALYAFMIPILSLGLISVFVYLPLIFFLLNAAGNFLKKQVPAAIKTDR
ncbi:MAG: carotenoid biosynthesis protein [Candidatus Falkowbacteria bacterium]